MFYINIFEKYLSDACFFVYKCDRNIAEHIYKSINNVYFFRLRNTEMRWINSALRHF